MAPRKDWKVCTCHVHKCNIRVYVHPETGQCQQGVYLKASLFARHQEDEKLWKERKANESSENTETTILGATLHHVPLSDPAVMSRAARLDNDAPNALPDPQPPEPEPLVQGEPPSHHVLTFGSQ